jgi:hypothetical protein
MLSNLAGVGIAVIRNYSKKPAGAIRRLFQQLPQSIHRFEGVL